MALLDRTNIQAILPYPLYMGDVEITNKVIVEPGHIHLLIHRNALIDSVDIGK